MDAKNIQDNDDSDVDAAMLRDIKQHATTSRRAIVETENPATGTVPLSGLKALGEKNASQEHSSDRINPGTGPVLVKV